MHGRMRAIDRDLIREGHSGQRSWEPRKQAEHMAAPTNAAYVQESPCQLGAVHTWGESGHDFLRRERLLLTRPHFSLAPCDQVATTFEFHAYLTLVVFTCPWSVFHRSNLAEDWEHKQF